MKNPQIYLFILILIFSGWSISAQDNGYKVNGRLQDFPEGTILTRLIMEKGALSLDTIPLIDGRFSFSGNVGKPYMVTLSAVRPGKHRTGRDDLQLYIESGTITVTARDSLKHASIEGSEMNDDYRRWTELTADIISERYELLSRHNAMSREQRNSPEMVGRRNEANRSFAERENERAAAFILANPSSGFAFHILYPRLATDKDPAATEKLLRAFDRRLLDTQTGSEYLKQVETWKKIAAAAAIAPDFTMNDTAGRPVSLSDFRGKYVLLDFWASWCGPCRAENPHVVEAYRKYSGRGFTVVGVSLDGLPSQSDPRKQWHDAIRKDGLEWTNLSDLAGWDTGALKLYGVKSVPANFLIDPDGRILATGLRGAALTEALEKYLGR